MSKMSELDSDRQQIERLTDVVPPPSFAVSGRAGTQTISPTPWELVEATKHHGPYIVNAYGADVCDLYAMSNPMAASVRNGGNSFPVLFEDSAANAEFIVRAVNAHSALVDAITKVRSIIADGAMTGFNCKDGDWADRLFASQAESFAALRLAQPVAASKTEAA